MNIRYYIVLMNIRYSLQRGCIFVIIYSEDEHSLLYSVDEHSLFFTARMNIRYYLQRI